jgi:hypothetical protein
MQLGKPAGKCQPAVKSPPLPRCIGQPAAQMLVALFELDDDPHGLHGASIGAATPTRARESTLDFCVRGGGALRTAA